MYVVRGGDRGGAAVLAPRPSARWVVRAINRGSECGGLQWRHLQGASKGRTYQTTTPGLVGCPHYDTGFLAEVQPICTPGVWLLGPSTVPAGTQRARARLGQVLHILPYVVCYNG